MLGLWLQASGCLGFFGGAEGPLELKGLQGVGHSLAFPLPLWDFTLILTLAGHRPLGVLLGNQGLRVAEGGCCGWGSLNLPLVCVRRYLTLFPLLNTGLSLGKGEVQPWGLELSCSRKQEKGGKCPHIWA